MANSITFRKVTEPENQLALAHIAIDGVELIELVRAAEAPEAARTGQPELAGAYSYIDLPRLTDIKGHFHGRPDAFWEGVSGRVILLACECGEPGCWPLEAEISVGDATVTWQNFRQPHRSWSYEKLGPFVFDRAQYDAALELLR